MEGRKLQILVLFVVGGLMAVCLRKYGQIPVQATCNLLVTSWAPLLSRLFLVPGIGSRRQYVKISPSEVTR